MSFDMAAKEGKSMSETTEVKPVDLEAGREWLKGVSPGPWIWLCDNGGQDDTPWLLDGDQKSIIFAKIAIPSRKIDCGLISVSRTLLPAALDEIEMLREKVEHLTKAFRLNARYKTK